HYIGRIMEFLAGKPPANRTEIRIGWFYRPKDVLHSAKKKHADPRLLVASMNSDVNPITSIRGKCHIEHMDEIQNIAHYRTIEDSFYYKQLYDRYTHRVYDVVPLDMVKNLPLSISPSLTPSCRYILVEDGRASDFTDMRICRICDRWCTPDQRVVRCVACEGAYHLTCVGLVKKPSKGYAWQCHTC
ncbi:hypothetical protein BDK51DRAFT_13355, partial [Blyttiomyces helicus]